MFGVGEHPHLVVGKRGLHLFGVEVGQFLQLQCMLTVVDKGDIRIVHGTSILLQKFSCKAAEGVQLHTRHQSAVGILFAHGRNGCPQFRRCMGEVLIHGAIVCLLHQLQPFACPTEGLDSIVELFIADSKSVACITGSGEVKEIVPTEDLQRNRHRSLW